MTFKAHNSIKPTRSLVIIATGLASLRCCQLWERRTLGCRTYFHKLSFEFVVKVGVLKNVEQVSIVLRFSQCNFPLQFGHNTAMHFVLNGHCKHDRVVDSWQTRRSCHAGQFKAVVGLSAATAGHQMIMVEMFRPYFNCIAALAEVAKLYSGSEERMSENRMTAVKTRATFQSHYLTTRQRLLHDTSSEFRKFPAHTSRCSNQLISPVMLNEVAY
jgi:hypothetical protein